LYIFYTRYTWLFIFADMPLPAKATHQVFSEEEKIKLRSVLGSKLMIRASMFSLMTLTRLGVLLFFNKYNTKFQVEDNLEIINVVFVVILVICSRLLISEIAEYRREVKSSTKRIVRTHIGGSKGNRILLGNKLVAKNEMVLDDTDFDLLKGGDEVILELSTKSNLLFSVKKIEE
jgi:hypothetical protein